MSRPVHRPTTKRSHAMVLHAYATLALVGGLAAQRGDLAREWRAPAGARVHVDSAEFGDPVAIARVDQPGSEPSDPRYFVAERSGTIKAIAQDGRITVLAAPPFGADVAERTELAGLAIADEAGFVFVSLRSGPLAGPLRAELLRIELAPRSLAGEPRRVRSIGGGFHPALMSPDEPFGSLAVSGKQLVVGVENRGEPRRRRDPEAAGGKHLLLDL